MHNTHKTLYMCVYTHTMLAVYNNYGPGRQGKVALEMNGHRNLGKKHQYRGELLTTETVPRFKKQREKEREGGREGEKESAGEN